jgi:hypothetical protein
MEIHRFEWETVYLWAYTHTLESLVDFELNNQFKLLQFQYGYEFQYLILNVFSFLKSSANDNFAYIGKLYMERKY